jgi:hypothetical protein
MIWVITAPSHAAVSPLAAVNGRLLAVLRAAELDGRRECP